LENINEQLNSSYRIIEAYEKKITLYNKVICALVAVMIGLGIAIALKAVGKI
jgi:hypothetical protein